MKNLEQRLSQDATTQFELAVAFKLPLPVYRVTGLSNDHALALGWDRRTVFDLKTGEVAFSVPENVYDAIKGDEQDLVQGINGRTSKLVDTPSGKRNTSSIFLYPNNVRLNIVGENVLVQSGDHKTFLNLRTGDVVFKASQLTYSRVFIAGDQALVQGFDYNTFYDLNKGGESVKYKPLLLPGCLEVFAIDGRALIQGENENSHIFYDLNTSQPYFTLPPHVSPRGCNQMNLVDGQLLILGLDNQTVYDVRTGKIAFKSPVNVKGIINDVDGQPIAQGVYNHRFHNLRTGKTVFESDMNLYNSLFFLGHHALAHEIFDRRFYSLETGRIALDFPQPVLGFYLVDGQYLAQERDNSCVFYRIDIKEPVIKEPVSNQDEIADSFPIPEKTGLKNTGFLRQLLHRFSK